MLKDVGISSISSRFILLHQTLIVCFVDYILWGGTSEFKNEVINTLWKIFVIASQFFESMQNKDNSVMSCQEDYAYSINTIPPLKYQSSNKESSITSETVTSVRSLAGIFIPDISFEIYKLKSPQCY